MRDWSSERGSHISKVTQLVNGQAEIQPHQDPAGTDGPEDTLNADSSDQVPGARKVFWLIGSHLRGQTSASTAKAPTLHCGWWLAPAWALWGRGGGGGSVLALRDGRHT